MDAIRSRLSIEPDRVNEHIEWAIAAALAAALVAALVAATRLAGVIVVRELRFAPSPLADAPAVPASTMPAEAVSVPKRVGAPRVAAIYVQ